MDKLKNINLKSNITIGLLFTIVSYLLSYTVVVPIFTIMYPALVSETIAKFFVSDISNKNIALFSIQFYLSISLIIYILSIYKQSKSLINKTSFNNIWFFCFQFFILHTIGFYIYWGKTLDYRGDGQLMFLTYYSFKYSSLAFVFLGILLEKSKFIPVNSLLKKFKKSTLNQTEEKNKKLFNQYQNLSDSDLQNIVNEDGWTLEAKKVAKSILDKRNYL